MLSCDPNQPLPDGSFPEDRVCELHQLSPSAKLAYCVLAGRLRRYNETFVTPAAIASCIGRPEHVATALLSELADAGLIALPEFDPRQPDEPCELNFLSHPAFGRKRR
jgi:hypothetical protein